MNYRIIKKELLDAQNRKYFRYYIQEKRTIFLFEWWTYSLEMRPYASALSFGIRKQKMWFKTHDEAKHKMNHMLSRIKTN